MRHITYIVLHCTATQPNAKIEAIQNYWRNELGWKSPGYHYIIKADGTRVSLQPENLVSNGVAGHNANSIHISYVGGIDKSGIPKDTRTPAQLESLQKIVQEMHEKYPKAIIQGHRDFPGVHKACPSFDVRAWLKEVGLNK